MELIIETEALSKQYGDTIVVDKVRLHVPRGKIYALLGRNGAGKTTLMKMLLRLVRSTGGRIRLFGEDCGKPVRNIDQRIGSIIETPGFYDNLTAYENLGILMRLRGLENPKKIRETLEIVGLQDESKKPFSDYSLGMKQRLGIAAAMMHEPELLILDEPINGLDPIGISEIRALLASLSRDRGVTILISSHVLSEIEQIADVIGVMHKGRLIEEVNMEEIRQRRRKYLEFEVADPVKALEILGTTFGINDCRASGGILKIYDSAYPSGSLNKVLVENGLWVSKVNENQENLEDYFSVLIGGGGIA
jgi:ABC-2 type transport system ATP-binding protein/bacitracin transport system ATP-binding protein